MNIKILSTIQYDFLYDVLPKYKEFLDITYRYPLIIELERSRTFRDLFLSLFCFYEKNKSNPALSFNIPYNFFGRSIYREIVNGIKHPKQSYMFLPHPTFKYDNEKKLFKFIKNSIEIKEIKINQSEIYDLEKNISEVIFIIASNLDFGCEGLENLQYNHNYYHFVYIYYHFTKTPLCIKNPINRFSIKYIKDDGSNLNPREIDYSYNEYLVSENRKNIIKRGQNKFVPIILAEYQTDKIILIAIDDKKCIKPINSMSFKEYLTVSLNQEFKLAISSLGYDLLYDYDREYSELFKKDKETFNLVQAF